MQRNGQWLDFGVPNDVPDTTKSIGGAKISVELQARGQPTPNAMSRIYNPPSGAQQEQYEDARYGVKDNTVENIYYPARETVVQKQGFLAEMASWLKGL